MSQSMCQLVGLARRQLLGTAAFEDASKSFEHRFNFGFRAEKKGAMTCCFNSRLQGQALGPRKWIRF